MKKHKCYEMPDSAIESNATKNRGWCLYL